MFEKLFRSFEEVKRFYFPDAYEKELTEKMTPEELAKYYAEKALKESEKKVCFYISRCGHL